jgi:60 kDa SS-A/Ro ribonucleoprotein
MPMGALLRNLNRLTVVGLVKPLSDEEAQVCAQLGDVERLRKARIHPLQVLMALKTYAQGHGMRGNLTWTPSQRVVDALNDAFYLSFQGLQPTGRNTFVAVDVSASMDWGQMGSTFLTAREAAAALAMVVARTEERYVMVGFSHQLMDLPISASDSLAAVVTRMKSIPMGGTDCALPMLSALHHDLDVEAFQVMTDNETRAGQVHPSEALDQYRTKKNPDAKLVVHGMTSTGFTIARPGDSGMLDVVGLDAAAPAVIHDFFGPKT